MCFMRNFLLLISVLLSIEISFADTYIPITAKSLFNKSHVIVYGKKIDQRLIKLDQKLYTIIEFKVDQIIKGETSDSVSIIYHGGIDFNSHFPVASYSSQDNIPRDNALLFLSPSEKLPNTYRVTDMINGQILITDDGKTRFKNLFSSEGIPLTSIIATINKEEPEVIAPTNIEFLGEKP